MYKPHRIPPSSYNPVPAQADMPIGDTLRHCPLRTPSQLRSWLVVGHSTTRLQPLEEYRPSSAPFHFSAHHNSLAHREGFYICFDRDYIEYRLWQMEEKWEDQTFRGFERELLEAQLIPEHQYCECSQHKVTILRLFPQRPCHIFYTYP